MDLYVARPAAGVGPAGLRSGLNDADCRNPEARQNCHPGQLEFMPAYKLKGSAVAIRWMCGLLLLASVFAYSRIAMLPHRAADRWAETLAIQVIAAPARVAADEDNGPVTYLADYVYLHETRNERGTLQAAAHYCGE